MKPNSTDNRYTIYRTKFLNEFQCLGDKCEDTCCKGWGMQVDAAHKELYAKEAPELLEAVTSGEHDIIMKRDPATDYCIKFDNGLCGIHKQYGEKFLGDACYFYPRATRQLGEKNAIMTATASCPEVIRLILESQEPFAFEQVAIERLPESIYDYLPESITAEQALAVVQAFLTMAADESITPERAMMRVVSVSHSLKHLKYEQWPEAVPFYLRSADGRMLPPEPHLADPYRLLHGLCGLVGASKKTIRPRLDETIKTMEKALDATMDWEHLQIINNAQDLSAYKRLKERWEINAKDALKPTLHRFLQSQLMLTLYPFAGFGNDWVEQATIMGVRFATIRLALMCHVAEDGTPPDQVTIIRVIQSLSRFLDHLMDPTLSIAFYREAGWTSETRMRGMLEG